MARVEDWFPEFAVTLQARCRRTDWPEFGTESGDEFWRTLEKNLRRHGATAEIADEASALVAARSLKYLGEYPAAILEAIKALRERIVEPTAPPPIARPENQPGPWDAIRTIQDLKDFCAALGPIATRIGRRPRQDRQPLAWHAPEAGDGRSDVPTPGTPQRGV